MSGRYKINPDDRKRIYAIADIQLRGNYHNLYKEYGLTRQGNGNFICPNSAGHLSGGDTHASVSIDNMTGVGHCFACEFRFNFPKYWKEYVANTSMDHNEGSYTSWLVDYLKLDTLPNIHIDGVSAPMSQQDQDNIDAMQKGVYGLDALYDKLIEHYKKEHGGQEPQVSQVASDMIKKVDVLSIDIINRGVTELLADPEVLEYLEQKRHIGKKVIEKYRIGMDVTEYGKRIIFPYFNGAGELLNIKAYQPWNEKYKWQYPHKGRGSHPSPLINFTHSKLYFFEGEPDTYCAIGFGIPGAVTLGSASKATDTLDIEKMFGDECELLFSGKEIVICLDCDEAGRLHAQALAKSLYKYAKQIKIINLDVSQINPHGLDPKLMKETVDEKGNKKLKRTEKDFTDFLRKNGFNDAAIARFYALELATEVYFQNDERVADIEYHVTLQEARNSKYASPLGHIKLKLIASVTDVDYNSYQMPTKILATCIRMTETDGKMAGMCAKCRLHQYPGFGLQPEAILDITTDRTTQTLNDRTKIALTHHQLLGLIEVTEAQKERNLKKFCGIPDRCQYVSLMDKDPKSLIRVRLGKDLRENVTNQTSFAEVQMDGYMMEKDIVPNRSYLFSAIQTTTYNSQYAVLHINEAEPIATSIDLFKMDDKTYDILRIFQPYNDKSIHDHLMRRYNVFGNLSGITGRQRMFFINDLAFFSAVEIRNKKILPEVTRGWVEVLIAGESRCAKTIVSQFLQGHYKVGDFVAGTSGVSISGLIGGISYFKNLPKISWGNFPKNDCGLVIIDEMSDMNVETLTALKDVRSRGVAQIDKIKSSAIAARVRKIFLSNERTYGTEQPKSHTYGIQMIKELCIKDSVLSRFDIVHYVKMDDVPTAAFSSDYQNNYNEFTEYQCQKLIQWAHSRSPDDIVFEDGIETYVNNMNIELNKRYHPSSQIINIEMRAKIIRMSVALATMLFSIPPNNDYNKIYVTIEHAKYIVGFLINEYDGKNMNLDRYSNMLKRSETLGDMRFMMNILEYVSIESILMNNEFTDNDLSNMFSDYLIRTLDRSGGRRLYMVDAMTDERKSTNQTIHEAQKRLIGLLSARNCIKKAKYGKYVKTEQFNQWLEHRAKQGEHAEKSDILEYISDEHVAQVYKEIGAFAKADSVVKESGNN